MNDDKKWTRRPLETVFGSRSQYRHSETPFHLVGVVNGYIRKIPLVSCSFGLTGGTRFLNHCIVFFLRARDCFGRRKAERRYWPLKRPTLFYRPEESWAREGQSNHIFCHNHLRTAVRGGALFRLGESFFGVLCVFRRKSEDAWFLRYASGRMQFSVSTGVREKETQYEKYN